jgi:hypothetical protein
VKLRHRSPPPASSILVLAVLLCVPACSRSTSVSLAETERQVGSFRQTLPRMRHVVLDRSVPGLSLRFTAYFENGELRCLEQRAAEKSGGGGFDRSFFVNDSLISYSSMRTIETPGKELVRVETELRFDPHGRLLDSRMRRAGVVSSLPPSGARWLRRQTQTLASSVRDDIARADSAARGSR